MYLPIGRNKAGHGTLEGPGQAWTCGPLRFLPWTSIKADSHVTCGGNFSVLVLRSAVRRRPVRCTPMAFPLPPCLILPPISFPLLLLPLSLPRPHYPFSSPSSFSSPSLTRVWFAFDTITSQLHHAARSITRFVCWLGRFLTLTPLPSPRIVPATLLRERRVETNRGQQFGFIYFSFLFLTF